MLLPLTATNTIAAVHQTGRYINRRHVKDDDINEKIIGKFNCGAGYTDKMWLRTNYDYKGEVIVEKYKINDNLIAQYKTTFSNSNNS